MTDPEQPLPEHLPSEPLVLDRRIVEQTLEWLAKSPHTPSEARHWLLLNAFSHPTVGLARRNYVLHYGVLAVARSIDPTYDYYRPKDPETKAGAFVYGARIGSVALNYHFNFHVPELTNEACSLYDIRLPVTTDDSTAGNAVSANSCVDEGLIAYNLNPALEELVDLINGVHLRAEPTMVQAGAGYVIYLAGYAAAYQQYKDTQDELAQLEKEYGDSLGGLFDNISPEDFS